MGYLIAPFLTELMQVVTNELPEYSMQVLTTKCLNTAVMIMYLFLGNTALLHTRFCDVTSVRARRSETLTDPSLGVIQALIADAVRGKVTAPQSDPYARIQHGANAVTTTKESNRVLYYVMITNGSLPLKDAPKGRVQQDTREFPGHVFVIERLTRGTYNLYQSYINHFTLKDLITINSSLSLSKGEMQSTLEGLAGIFADGVWSAKSTAAWEKLSHVKEDRFEGRVFRGNVLACYSRVTTEMCIDELRIFLDRILKKLAPLAIDSPGLTYGNTSMYQALQPPNIPPLLSNLAMYLNLSRLRGNLGSPSAPNGPVL